MVRLGSILMQRTKDRGPWTDQGQRTDEELSTKHQGLMRYTEMKNGLQPALYGFAGGGAGGRIGCVCGAFGAPGCGAGGGPGCWPGGGGCCGGT